MFARHPPQRPRNRKGAAACRIAAIDVGDMNGPRARAAQKRNDRLRVIVGARRSGCKAGLRDDTRARQDTPVDKTDAPAIGRQERRASFPARCTAAFEMKLIGGDRPAGQDMTQVAEGRGKAFA
jgi:hypothetical protein